MPVSSFETATAKLQHLAHQGLELPDFWRGASDVLAGAIPHYASPCWWTLDPASLLVTSHFQPDVLELPAEMLAHEYLEDDFHSLAGIARSARGISTIHEATGGDPARSPGWRQFVQAYGAHQEVLVALRTRSGDVWGVAGLYRAAGEPWFSPEEMRFLTSVAPILADGARRGLLVGEARDPDGPNGPGLVVLTPTWEVESGTPAAEHWLHQLSDRERPNSGALPPAVVAIAGQTLAVARAGGQTLTMPSARVRTRAGVWLELHGATLEGGGTRNIVVILEPVEPIRVASLLMAAYGLTAREQETTRLVLQGCSTAEIASGLNVRPQTVQQHLKSIFDKTRVRSRRELVGKVFFGHFEPRLRENERRSLAGRGLRGAPRTHTSHSASGVQKAWPA